MYFIREAYEHHRNVELHLYRKVCLLVRPSVHVKSRKKKGQKDASISSPNFLQYWDYVPGQEDAGRLRCLQHPLFLYSPPGRNLRWIIQRGCHLIAIPHILHIGLELGRSPANASQDSSSKHLFSNWISLSEMEVRYSFWAVQTTTYLTFRK